MSAHTPGPWRELVSRIDDASGYQIAHLDLHGKSEAERDANRRLIAAAPDMLQELRDVLDWARTENAPLRAQEIASIEAVIAKAVKS